MYSSKQTDKLKPTALYFYSQAAAVNATQVWNTHHHRVIVSTPFMTGIYFRATNCTFQRVERFDGKSHNSQ
jgi:hypothetical protein